MSPLLRIPLTFCLLLLLTVCAAAQMKQEAVNADVEQLSEPERPVVQATRLTHPITVDGNLDEELWTTASVITDFKQREPNQGEAPTERTEVRILYDDEAIFIGARLYDSAPDSITATLGRRDSYTDSDLFGFFIDPYLDRRSGYYFVVSAAGTLLDGILLNDDWDDDSWDGVWQGRVTRDSGGWNAEMRIPYSQLRFKSTDVHRWGVNFRRDISRKNEQDYLVYTPRKESGFVSRFADLDGIENIDPPRQIEATVYATGRGAFTQAASGDPFNDGSRYTPDAGVDFKVGLTNDITLNGTVNPDFGQVEVDPAVVNLTDFETFFPERRPFFVEGASIFEFGRGGSNNNWGFNWGGADFFYTRRIGRRPQGSLPGHEYADVPDGTPILGAAKLTGKTANDWRFGTIQALTGRTHANVYTNGATTSSEIEPATYYGVVRGIKEYRDGFRALGFMTTAAARSFDDDRLRSEINSGAWVGALDGWTFLDKDKVWVLTGWAGASHITGSTDRITAVQRRPQHYFQRPDASYAQLDTSATSLTGLAGRVMLNKQSGRWTNNTALAVISPSFDINDLGFQSRGNLINGHTVFSYRWTEPKSFYRRVQVNSAVYGTMDFDGNRTGGGFFSNGNIQFKNYYWAFLGGAIVPERKNTTRTRGGPVTRSPLLYEMFGGFETDSRKRVVLEGFGFYATSDAGQQYEIESDIELKPASNVLLRIGPGLSGNRSKAQWVGSFADPLATETFGRRYVFGNLNQKTVSANLRLNWTFTPQLSFQLFAQPLISSGQYTSFKELRRPDSFDFRVFGEEGSTFDAENFVADPDGDGPAAPISWSNPDFNFKSLRGTAVLRWEYRLGSIFYLVWTQSRDHFEDVGELRFGPSVDTLIREKPDNIFAMKFTYWLSR